MPKIRTLFCLIDIKKRSFEPLVCFDLIFMLVVRDDGRTQDVDYITNKENKERQEMRKEKILCNNTHQKTTTTATTKRHQQQNSVNRRGAGMGGWGEGGNTMHIGAHPLIGCSTRLLKRMSDLW